MLEPTEPTEGSENTTPSDTLPPRRRRRAASRPAGPPTVAADTATPEAPTTEVVTETVVAIPATETVEAIEATGAEENEETEAVAAAAVASEPEPAEPVAEEAAPRRARRRATRRVSAPAGAPESAEAVEVVVPGGAESTEVPAAVVADEPQPAESAEPVQAATEEAAPRRARRRATRRVSAPAETVETPAAQPAAQDAGTPVSEAGAEPAERPAAEAPVAETPAAEEEAAPRRTRRRATRRVSAPADETTAAHGEAPVTAAEETGRAATEAAEAPEAAPSQPEPVAEEAAPRRARRRVVRKAAGGFAEPAKPATGETAETVQRPARPAVAVFQAPVFTEPMFQTPERAAAAAAAEAAEQEEPVEEEPVGQRRRRRRRGGDEEPVAVTPETTDEVHETDEVEETEEPEESAEGEEAEESGSRRRRRRGGRRRRRGETAEGEDADELAAEQAEQDAEDTAEQLEEDAEEADEQHDEESAAGGGSSSRRRRRRRRRAGDTGADTEPTSDDPERTVVKVREPRKKEERAGDGTDEVQSIKGSTRLEAKKQRRREGREQGRRRVPIITEAEFLARREAVERVMVVRQSGERTQIGVLEDGVLVEHYVNKEQSTSYVGNVYLGKVQNVLPSMEAAFIDIGKGRNAVLYAGEVNFEALGMANGPRRIESALKSGQSVLVQVTKDPIGHKGARLTSQVSLPGRYLVYVPEGSMTGISRKLPDTERARLKTILKKIVPEDAGVIVRTAAEGASEDELRRDVERLQAQWEEIRKKSKNGSAPTLLYGEPDMTVRVVRDIFNEDFSKVIVSGDEAWQTIHGYVSHVAPDLAGRLQRWTSEVDVFATYRIDEQLAKALDRKVWLPSGGSLVIDRTEAMVVIDVNTGKFTGQGGNLEETVTRNNLEAAEEIVRQLRLRDLGGIIVIDFIDMVLESNRDLVLRRLLECLGRDRTKHQVAEVTSLGLVQMTRKRVGQGLLESFSETCAHCNGRGVIVHMDQPSAPAGGKRKKRGRGGAEAEPETHEAVAAEIEEAAEAVAAAAEIEAAVAAEVAAPAALPEPEFAPDEELYSSVAEAEAAATRGRSRRRVTRRASAPAGAPRSEERAPRSRRDDRAPKSRQDAEAEPTAAEDPVVEAPAPVEEEAAPKGRTRRRATRRASAPAGSPAEAVVTVGEPAPQAEALAGTPEAPAEVVDAVQTAEAPVEGAAPARPRRRAVRKATAPTASEEAAVVVVPATAEEPAAAGEPSQAAEAPVPASGAPAEGEAEAEAEVSAPAKKAARKTAKKATAKKAATKKTTATKTAAKKTVAKKTVAKKTTAKKAAAKKTAAKKTAAAEQTAQPTVSVTTED
ncbi:Rne/Rng family ribonuclease [Streptomyces sp. NPDC047079]|uniref:Rne/Rng family ribonuclease n=1 Tax=Streptomyces sp. NPDC047079 TaxID=3154607 RepID=UPI0033E05851